MLNAKQVARLETLNLDAETTMKQVRDFVTGLLKSGSITDGDANELRRIASDKDMGPEDVLDELRAIMDSQQPVVNSGANTESNLDPAEVAEVMSEVQAILVADDVAAADAELVAAVAMLNNAIEISEPETVAPSSLLAGLVSQITDPVVAVAAPVAPKAVPEKTGKTIEANRVEQNGLKRPSKGSTCAIIWENCDRITAEKGSTCTSGELFAACQGLNECTLRTQYARWRQFNGVTGRLPGQVKVAKVPAEFQDVLDNLAARLSTKEKIDTLMAVKTSDELVTWMSANFINF